MNNLLYHMNLSSLPETLMLGRIRQPFGWRNTGRKAPADMLILATEGCIEFRACEKQIRLREGDCVLLPEGTFYTASCLEEACEYVFIHFRTAGKIMPAAESAANESMARLSAEQRDFRGKYPYSLPPTDYDAVFIRQKTVLGKSKDAALLLISKCESLRFESMPNRKLGIDLYLAQLLTTLGTDASEAEFPAISAPPALLKILTYIQQNYTRKLALQELSQEFQLSKQYITRIFQRNLHCTATEYINSLKLYHSLELLKYSTLKVCEVAEILGFGSAYYFCRLFKRQYRMTPGEYIKSELGAHRPV